MALHFPIMVNGGSIGQVYIRRLNKQVVPGETSRYEYEVEYPLFAGAVTRGELAHDYEDGALVLIQKVLTKVIGGPLG